MISEKAKIEIKADFFSVCQDMLTVTTKPGDVDRVINAMYKAGLKDMINRELDNIDELVKILRINPDD